MKNKAVIALLVILVMVFGFLAFLLSNGKLTSSQDYENEVATVEKTSDSDDVDSIEKDLQETDFNNIDNELPQIEMELK